MRHFSPVRQRRDGPLDLTGTRRSIPARFPRQTGSAGWDACIAAGHAGGEPDTARSSSSGMRRSDVVVASIVGTGQVEHPTPTQWAPRFRHVIVPPLSGRAVERRARAKKRPQATPRPGRCAGRRTWRRRCLGRPTRLRQCRPPAGAPVRGTCPALWRSSMAMSRKPKSALGHGAAQLTRRGDGGTRDAPVAQRQAVGP